MQFNQIKCNLCSRIARWMTGNRKKEGGVMNVCTPCYNKLHKRMIEG